MKRLLIALTVLLFPVQSYGVDVSALPDLVTPANDPSSIVTYDSTQAAASRITEVKFTGVATDALLGTGVFGDLSAYTLDSEVLKLDNTTPFTPDADYEPATKLYVDTHTSPLEVEDEAVSLDTAVTKFNFAGTGVIATEPVDHEILVTIPGAAGSGLPAGTNDQLIQYVGTVGTAVDGLTNVGLDLVGSHNNLLWGTGDPLLDDTSTDVNHVLSASEIASRISTGVAGAVIYFEKDRTITSPLADDDYTWYRAARPQTITSFYCIIDPGDVGDTMPVDLYECDSSGINCASVLTAAITVDNTGVYGVITDSAIAQGAWVRWDLSTPTGSVTALTCTIGGNY